MRFDIAPKTCFKWFADSMQNLRNSLFTSGILSNTSTAIGSFFAWASLALLCNKTRSAIATGHFPLPPLQQVQDSNQNMQIFQAGNENFLDLNRQKLNYDSIRSQCVPYVMPTSLWRRLLRLPCHRTRSWCLPARIFKLIQVFGSFIICIMAACVWRHCQALLIGWCVRVKHFVRVKHVLLFCCVWCSHFQVVFPTVTDTLCMFVVADSFCITWQVKQP